MNKNELRPLAPDDEDVNLLCPECETLVHTEWQVIHFKWGLERSQIELSANLPVRICPNCGFKYLDYVGEDLKHEAVCRHLGVLTPRAIKQIRTRKGMTRSEFAKLTGLGEASIGRWERGELIQSIANDRYLRLLAATDGVLRLRDAIQNPTEEGTEGAEGFTPEFRVVSQTEQSRIARSNFSLRSASTSASSA